jgi:hypothetical protein
LVAPQGAATKSLSDGQIWIPEIRIPDHAEDHVPVASVQEEALQMVESEVVDSPTTTQYVTF